MTRIVNKYKTLRTCRGDVWGTLFAKLIEKQRRKPLKAFKILKKPFNDSRRLRNFGNLLLLDHRRGSKYKRRGKPTLYGAYLTARQRLRNFYGIMRERELRAITRTAIKGCSFKIGGSPFYLAGLMELRIDTVLWRARFADSVRAIRQMIVHGHVYVNGDVVNKPNYHLKIGDYVNVTSCCDISNQIEIFSESLLFPPLPNHLDVDYSTFTVFIIDKPHPNKLFYPFNGSIYDLLWFYDVRYSS